MPTDEFDLEFVTNKLGINPTRARKRCDFPQPSIDAGFATDEWSYEVREKNCDNIAVPFNKIYNLFREKVDDINNLCNDINIIADFTVIIYTKTGNTALNCISKEILSFVASIHAKIGFDLYCYEDNGEFKIFPYTKKDLSC